MDHISKEKRSWNMSLIRSKNTSIEKIVRSYLFGKGFRYSLHNNEIIGKPDLFFKKYNVAVFINGCFWHRHKDCNRCTSPKTNKKYWVSKFKKNTKRDEFIYRELKKVKIRVLIIWECEVNDEKKLEFLYNKIINV